MEKPKHKTLQSSLTVAALLGLMQMPSLDNQTTEQPNNIRNRNNGKDKQIAFELKVKRNRKRNKIARQSRKRNRI